MRYSAQFSKGGTSCRAWKLTPQRTTASLSSATPTERR
jgi:hypothetical protein